MADFFKEQLDYILFFYGLGFILLSAVCFILWKDKRQRLPWLWFGLFGLTHGIHEWLDIMGVNIPLNLFWMTVHSLLLTASFLFLIEFGRTGERELLGRGPGRRIFVPLLAFTALGGLSGYDGLNVLARYILGLTGGFWAAKVLFLESRRLEGKVRRWLLAGSAATAMYAMLATVSAGATFFPASVINSNAFLILFGFPVHLLRGLLSFSIAVSIWVYSQKELATREPDLHVAKPRHVFRPVFILIGIIAAGWLCTIIIGNHARDEDAREGQLFINALSSHLSHVMAGAVQLSRERANSPSISRALLTGSPGDLKEAQSVMNICKMAGECIKPACYVLDRNGRLLLSCTRRGYAFSKEIYRRPQIINNVLAGRGEASFIIDRPTGSVRYFAACPVRDGKGQVIGATVVDQPLSDIEASLRERIYCFLVDGKGTVFMSGRKGALMQKLWPAKGGRAIQPRPMLAEEPRSGKYASMNGSRFLASRQNLEDRGWSLVYLGHTNHIRNYRLFSIFVTFVFCSSTIVLFAATYFTRESAIRLEAMVKERTAELSESNTQLHREINERMLAEKAVELLNHQKELILKSAGEGIYGLDLDGNTTFANPAAAAMIGWEADELIGRRQHDILHHSRPDGAPYPAEECPIYAVLRDGVTRHVADEVFWRKDGTSFPVEYVSTPIVEEGVINGAVVIFNDISLRKEMNAALKDSEERFRSLFDMASDCIMLLDPSQGRDAVVVDANVATCSMHGYERKELIGKPITFLDDPESARDVPQIIGLLMKGEAITFEMKHVRKDGSVFPVEVSAKLIDLGGRSYVIAIDRDITERKQAEEHRQMYTTELEKYAVELDRRNNELRRAEEELGRYREHLEDLIKRRTAELIMTNENLQREIAGRKRIEAELQESEHFVQRILDTTPNLLYIYDIIEKKNIYTNREVTDLLGYSPGEIRKMGPELFNKILHPEDEAAVAEHHRRFSEAGDAGVFEIEYRMRHADGQWRWLHSCDVVFSRAVGGQARQILGVAEDITERKIADEILKQSEERFRKLSMEFNTLLDAIPDALMLLSRGMKVLWANNSAGKILGRDVARMSGEYCHELWQKRSSPCDNCAAVRCFGSGKVESSQSMTPDGRFWSVRAFPMKDDEGGVGNVVVLTSDITEKITLQAEALRAGQLAALGELAAGMAHEINNPVSSIINYAQVILDEKEDSGIVKDEIPVRIIKEGERIAGIIRSLLSFARDRKEEKRPEQVHRILSDSLALAEAHMRKDGIRLEVNLPDGLPDIFAHAQQIQQVFLNIINNARYALNQKYPGAHREKKFEIMGEGAVFDKVRFVRLRFFDQGTGIPSSIIDKVMNPFFSTKPSGKGTGLGLSISHGIVSDHGGRIVIDSREGDFTRVTIDLPAADEKEIDEKT